MVETIGLVSAGEMGAGIGGALTASGRRELGRSGKEPSTSAARRPTARFRTRD